MKTIRFFLLWCMVVAISACTPFYRGFEGSTLVSPARPDVSVSVVDMPMLAHGQIAPFLNTDQGYQFPETLVSVYGTDAASPVAIVALSFVPSNAWEWDPLSFSGPMAQQNMGTVFGGESFYGSVRIVNGAKDPFAPLFAPEDQWASLDWLVQRFACLNDFRRSKLILEYREPLPASLKGVSEVPVYNEAVQAFRERAAKVFHVAPDQVTHEMRRQAKAVNFGIVYGISDFSLSQDIGVTRAEAKAYMEKYFEKYSGVHAYMTQVVERAKADGYVSTLMGRRRWLPELKSSNFNLRSFGERVALNMPIQGTAADLIKKAMLHVDGRLRREGLEARLVLQVHDELIVECPEGEAEQVQRLLAEEMEHVAELAVPLTAEAHAGKSWAEAKG